MRVINYHQLTHSSVAIECKTCGTVFSSPTDPRLNLPCHVAGEKKERTQRWGLNRKNRPN